MGKKKIKVIFISGSRTVRTLTKKIRTAIKDMVLIPHKKGKNIRVIIGDCYGADSTVQNYLVSKGYTNIWVYHIGKNPRFLNAEVAGTVRVSGNKYTDKDKAMCQHADKLLVICKNNSLGSMSNISRAKKLGKKVRLLKVK